MRTFFQNIFYCCFLVILLIGCEDDFAVEENYIDNRPEGVGGVSEVNPFWDWTNFPGPVSEKIPRLGRDTIHFFVCGDYEKDLWIDRDSGDTLEVPSPWFGPGLYAAVMEPITVRVPEGVTNLRCLVGSHPHNLGVGYNERNPKPRWADIQDTIYLKPGKNTFSSYFGGMIYFYWQDKTEPMKPGVDVIISGGCVRANNYVAGKTDYEKWIQTVRSYYIKDTIGVDDDGNLIVQDRTSDALKWVDMVGKYVTVTCPFSDFEDAENPAACLEAIDNWMRGVFDLYGYPTVQKDGKLFPQRRIVSDVASGRNDPWYAPSLIAVPVTQYYRGCFRSRAFWDYDFMTMSAKRPRLTEEMLTVWGGVRANGLANAILPPAVMQYYLAARFYHKLPAVGYDLPYLCSDENPYRHLPKRFQNKETSTACFIALVNEFDWGLIPYCVHAARATGFSQQKGSGHPNNRFAMHACEYTNMNLEGFFESWGWELPAYAIQYMRTFPEPEEEFWLHFRDRIAEYNEDLPAVKSTLQTKEPRDQWMSNDDKKKWSVKSGLSSTDARKAIDGGNDERRSLMANNVNQEDAWVEVDFHDTLHINVFSFSFPNSFVGIARSIRLKLGNYTDDAKTQVDWQYVKNSKGEPMEFRLRCWRGQGNNLNLPQMYRAELARIEIVTMGYHRNFIDINPWPTTCGIGEVGFGRCELPLAKPDWPYPYIPPVEEE